MRKTLARLFLPFSVILFTGLAFAEQQSLSVRYGQITGIEVTTKESAVARNAIIGGVIGVLVDDSFSGALGGATAGFLVTSIIEGDRRLYLYTIRMNDDGHRHCVCQIQVELSRIRRIAPFYREVKA